VEVALRRVQPAQSGHAFPGREEVIEGRLVRADLLGGDDELELDGEVAPRRGDQVVVDIGENGQLVARRDECLERGVRVVER